MMQMQKIKRLCLSHGTFAIVNGGGVQWLGDGAALFAVPGGATVDAEMLAAVFDLTDKQVRGCSWSVKTEAEMLVGGVDLSDEAESDVLLHELPASVSIAGDTLEMLYSDDGEIALLVSRDELAPVEKYTEAQYYARRNGKGWAVVVKNGYALVAYVLPWRIGGDAITDTILRMRDVLGRMIAGMRREVPVDVDSAEILQGLKAAFREGAAVDPETGEVRG